MKIKCKGQTAIPTRLHVGDLHAVGWGEGP